MFLYLDSSALVTCYIDEPHSEDVSRPIDETSAIMTSAISRVEVGSALARAARGHRLDAKGARGAQEQFTDDWSDLAKVAVTDTLLTRAERLARKHGLQAYDAVQLATALICREAITRLDESVVFGCFDGERTAAASEEGLRNLAERLRARHQPVPPLTAAADGHRWRPLARTDPASIMALDFDSSIDRQVGRRVIPLVTA